MPDLSAVVLATTMPEDMLQEAVDTSAEAMDKYTTSREMAAYIKKLLDKKYKETWHCVVGKDFGSFVTHEEEYFADFTIGDNAFLVFRT